MSLHDRFNHTGFSRFINSRAGSIFRLVAGTGFLVAGIVYRHHPLGIASLLWSPFPLSSGLLDLCWISAALGGPLKGSVIRTSCGHPPRT